MYLFNFMDPEPMRGPAGSYRTLLEKGLDRETVTSALRRHPVTYRDTVPPEVSNSVVLPVEGRQGGTFQIYSGPVPNKGRVVFLAGLATRDSVADATFNVVVNEASCKPLPDYPKSDEFPGVTRAVQFDCPLSSLKEGYNRVAIQQPSDRTEQQIVWAELRVAPGSSD
jgi:hypothetical protein